MDPNLTYHIILNATNASLTPIVLNVPLNVTLNPPLNATLIQSPISWDQILLQSGGPFLAGIIALISFSYVNLRGPRIVGSFIRYAAMGQTEAASNLILKFNLNNVGGSSAAVDFLAIELRCISPGNANFRFISYFDGSLLKELSAGKNVTSLTKPVLPFVIKNGDAITKEVTFARAPAIKIDKGKYILIMHALILHRQRIWNKLWNAIRRKSENVEEIVLRQNMSIKEDYLLINEGARPQFKEYTVYDPNTHELTL